MMEKDNDRETVSKGVRIEVGAKVYHAKINQNLVVAKVMHNGDVQCIDTKSGGGVYFSTMWVREEDIELGWKTEEELKTIREKVVDTNEK